MINAGDTIVNPITGERIVFHKTSASTGGECVEIEVFVQPGGVVAAAHVHPYQTERFEILGGTIGMKVGRKKIEARYGDVLTVEPGTAHKFWNAGDDQLHFVCVVSPALQFEQLLETMFALAADGKTNRKGMPNPLRLAVIARANVRHRPAPARAGLDAANGAGGRRPARQAPGLRGDLHAGRRSPGARGGVIATLHDPHATAPRGPSVWLEHLTGLPFVDATA